MRLGKSHPTRGWLHLMREHYSPCLDRLLAERDRLDDQSHVGPAPAFLEWVETVQLPALMQHDYYRKQADARLHKLARDLELVQDAISTGRIDRQPESDAITAEIAWLENLLKTEATV